MNKTDGKYLQARCILYKAFGKYGCDSGLIHAFSPLALVSLMKWNSSWFALMKVGQELGLHSNSGFKKKYSVCAHMQTHMHTPRFIFPVAINLISMWACF